MTNKMWRKIISSIVTTMMVFSLTGMQYLYSAVGQMALSPTHLVNAELILSPQHGRVLERFQGTGNKTIVCIQDLHCHKEVQDNISNILGVIHETYNKKLKVVSVEGAWGKLDTSFIHTIPQGFGVRERLVEELMERGAMTGAEKFGVAFPKIISLIGAEDSRTYHKDGRLLVASLPLRKNAVAGIEEIRIKINEYKNIVYSKDLKKFEVFVNKYENGNISITRYIRGLKQESESLGIAFALEYPNLAKVLLLAEKRMRLGKMPAIHKEAQDVENLLRKRISKKERKKLETLRKEGTDRYYIYLMKLIADKNFSIKNSFFLLDSYLQYLKLSLSINTTMLVDEEMNLQYTIRDIHAVTRSSKRVVFLDKYTTYLKHFVTNSITLKEKQDFISEESNYFAKLNDLMINSRADISWEASVRTYINDIKKAIEVMKKFYSVAEERNNYLVKNTLDAPRTYKKKTDLGVLIAGGYHTEGITQILRSLGISYILISPNITQDVDDSIYHARLQAQAETLGYITSGGVETFALMSMGQTKDMSNTQLLENMQKTFSKEEMKQAQNDMMALHNKKIDLAKLSVQELQVLRILIIQRNLLQTGLSRQEIKSFFLEMGKAVVNFDLKDSMEIKFDETTGFVTVIIKGKDKKSIKLTNHIDDFASAKSGLEFIKEDIGTLIEKVKDNIQIKKEEVKKIIDYLSKIKERENLSIEDKIEIGNTVNVLLRRLEDSVVRKATFVGQKVEEKIVQMGKDIEVEEEGEDEEAKKITLSDIGKDLVTEMRKAKKIGKFSEVSKLFNNSIKKEKELKVEKLKNLTKQAMFLMGEKSSSDIMKNIKKGALLSDIQSFLQTVYMKNKQDKKTEHVIREIRDEYNKVILHYFPLMVIKPNTESDQDTNTFTQAVKDRDESLIVNLDPEKDGLTTMREKLNTIGRQHGHKKIVFIFNLKVFSPDFTDALLYKNLFQEYADRYGVHCFISLEKPDSLKQDKPGMFGMYNRVSTLIGDLKKFGTIAQIPMGGSKTRFGDTSVVVKHTDKLPEGLPARNTIDTSFMFSLANILKQKPEEMKKIVSLRANDNKGNTVTDENLNKSIRDNNNKIFMLHGPDIGNNLLIMVKKYLDSIGKTDIEKPSNLTELRKIFTNVLNGDQKIKFRNILTEYVKGKTIKIGDEEITDKNLTGLGMYFKNSKGEFVTFTEKPKADVLVSYILDNNDVHKAYGNAFIDIVSKDVLLGLYNAMNVPVTKDKTIKLDKKKGYYDKTDTRDKVEALWQHEVSFFQTVVQAYFTSLEDWMKIRTASFPHISETDWKYMWLVVNYKKDKEKFGKDLENILKAKQEQYEKMFGKKLQIADIMANMPEFKFEGAEVINWKDVGNPAQFLASFVDDANKIAQEKTATQEQDKIKIYLNNGKVTGEIKGQGNVILESSELIIEEGGNFIIEGGPVVLKNSRITVKAGQTLKISGGNVLILNSEFSGRHFAGINKDSIIQGIVVGENEPIEYYKSGAENIEKLGYNLSLPPAFTMAAVPHIDENGKLHKAAVFNPYRIPWKGVTLDKYFSGASVLNTTFGRIKNIKTEIEKAPYKDIPVDDKALKLGSQDLIIILQKTAVDQVDIQQARDFLVQSVQSIFEFTSDDDVKYIQNTILTDTFIKDSLKNNFKSIMHSILNALYQKKYSFPLALNDIGIKPVNKDLMNMPRYPMNNNQAQAMKQPGTYENLLSDSKRLSGLTKQPPIIKEEQAPVVIAWGGVDTFKALIEFVEAQQSVLKKLTKITTYANLVQAINLVVFNDVLPQFVKDVKDIADMMGVDAGNVKLINDDTRSIAPIQIGNNVYVSTNFLRTRRIRNRFLTEVKIDNFNVTIAQNIEKKHEAEESKIFKQKVNALIADKTNKISSINDLTTNQIIELLRASHAEALMIKKDEQELMHVLDDIISTVIVDMANVGSVNMHTFAVALRALATHKDMQKDGRLNVAAFKKMHEFIKNMLKVQVQEGIAISAKDIFIDATKYTTWNALEGAINKAAGQGKEVFGKKIFVIGPSKAYIKQKNIPGSLGASFKKMKTMHDLLKQNGANIRFVGAVETPGVHIEDWSKNLKEIHKFYIQLIVDKVIVEVVATAAGVLARYGRPVNIDVIKVYEELTGEKYDKSTAYEIAAFINMVALFNSVMAGVDPKELTQQGLKHSAIKKFKELIAQSDFAEKKLSTLLTTYLNGTDIFSNKEFGLSQVSKDVEKECFSVKDIKQLVIAPKQTFLFSSFTNLNDFTEKPKIKTVKVDKKSYNGVVDMMLIDEVVTTDEKEIHLPGPSMKVEFKDSEIKEPIVLAPALTLNELDVLEKSKLNVQTAVGNFKNVTGKLFGEIISEKLFKPFLKKRKEKGVGNVTVEDMKQAVTMASMA